MDYRNILKKGGIKMSEEGLAKKHFMEGLITEESVKEALRPIYDPEIGISIVDLGLVYGVKVDKEKESVSVDMTFTTPMCPMGPQLISSVETTTKDFTQYEKVEVNLVWDPPWNPKEMASDEAKDLLGIW